MKDQENNQKIPSQLHQEEGVDSMSGTSLPAPNYGGVSQMSSLPSVSTNPVVQQSPIQKKSLEGEEEGTSDSEVVQSKLATSAPPPYNNNGKPAPVQMKTTGASTGGSEQAMAESMAKKTSNANYITDEIFFARHKDMPRRKLKKRSSDPEEQILVKEWLQIKSGIVLPAIQKVRNGGGEEEKPENEEPGTENPEKGDPKEGDKEGDEKGGGGSETEKPANGGGNAGGGTDQGGGTEGGTKEGEKGQPAGGGGGGFFGDFDLIGTGGNIARMIFEIGRIGGPLPTGPIPLPVGPLCGLAANTINLFQDAATSWNLDDNGLLVLTGLRNLTNIVSGFLSDLSYCVTTIQDLAAGSVIGVELLGITVPINEAIDFCSVVLDTLKVLLDVMTEAYAFLRASEIAVSDPEKAEQFRSMGNGYFANAVADSISAMFDIFDIISGGLLQGEPADKFSQVAFSIGRFGDELGSVFKTVLTNKGIREVVMNNNLLKTAFNTFVSVGIGIWGGGVVDKATGTGSDTNAADSGKTVQPKLDNDIPAQFNLGETAQDLTGDYLLYELKGAETAVNLGTEAINKLPEIMQTIFDFAEKHIAELTGSKEPFKDLIGLATEEMEHLEEELVGLAGLKEKFNQVGENIDSAYAYIQDLEGALDNIQMPDIDIFSDKDIGDNPIADLIEDVVNTGQDVAEEALKLILNQVEAQVNKVKQMIRTVIDSIKEQLDFCVKWAKMIAENIDRQIIFVAELVERVKSKLSECENFEDLFNAMLSGISEVLGLDEDITIDSLIEQWNDFDKFIQSGISFAQVWVNENVKANPSQMSENKGGAIPVSSSSENDDLDPAFRSSIEKHTKTSVSDFSISKNDKKADNMGAKAYNQGNDLVFGKGQYNPKSKDGKFLIAHEMAHSIQNNNLKATGEKNGMKINDDPSLEQEADSVAKKIVDDSEK